MPHDVRDPLADHPREQVAPSRVDDVGGAGHPSRDAGRFQRLACPDQFGRQRQLPVARDGGAHVGEGVASQPLQIEDLGLGADRVGFDETAGQFGLDRDDREAVAEDVVQVAGEPGAFELDGQLGLLLAGAGQRVAVSTHGDRPPHDAADGGGPQRQANGPQPGVGERQRPPEHRHAAPADRRQRLPRRQGGPGSCRHIRQAGQSGQAEDRSEPGGDRGEAEQPGPRSAAGQPPERPHVEQAAEVSARVAEYEEGQQRQPDGGPPPAFAEQLHGRKREKNEEEDRVDRRDSALPQIARGESLVAQRGIRCIPDNEVVSQVVGEVLHARGPCRLAGRRARIGGR